MSDQKSVEIRVSVDVGYRRHSVAIGLPSGEVLEEFEIAHRPEGFAEFFSRIEKHQKVRDCEVAVAMEGFNGCARPLDAMVRRRGYRLYNINNLKLARFKEIFPGAAKSDRIDARKGLELFQLSDHLPLAKEVLQEVKGTPRENEVLKRLTRRRRRLVDERVRVISNLQTDLQAVCPGLLEITKNGRSDKPVLVLSNSLGCDQRLYRRSPRWAESMRSSLRTGRSEPISAKRLSGSAK